MRSSTWPSADRPTRRALLAAAALLLVGKAAVVPALAQTAGPYGRIIVDVAPLEAKGMGSFARVVQAAVEAAAAKSFAGAVTPGAGGLPTLIIQVSGVSLSAYVGGGGFRLNDGGAPNDYMEGRLITRMGGKTLTTLPMLSALPSTSGGAWYAPDNDQRRLLALAEHFTWWSRRKLKAYVRRVAVRARPFILIGCLPCGAFNRGRGCFCPLPA
jgi:hypothetical protein